MSLELVGRRWRALDGWTRAAVFVWVAATVFVCARSAVAPHRASVYPVWLGAAHDWLTSHDLYEEHGDPVRFGFRYGPPVAACFAVCDLIPEGAGNAAWRLLNVAAYLAALSWWLRAAAPFTTTPAQRGLFFLLTAPLALGSMHNGQANLLLIALMTAAVAAVVQDRWWLSALCMAAAVALKVYPVAMVLLLIVAYPRRYPLRFAVALLAVAALPFLMQHPHYVARQYMLWWDRIKHGDNYRRFWPLYATYRDVWLLTRVWGLPVSLPQYTAFQAACGGACAAVCGWVAWRGWPSRERTFVVLSLATAWMLLVGPAPESCTFVLIAPALVGQLLCTFGQKRWAAHYLAAGGLLLLYGGVLSGATVPGIQLYHVAGVHPLGMLLVTGSFLTTALAARPTAVSLQRPAVSPLETAA
jgi:hypothetical protein